MKIGIIGYGWLAEQIGNIFKTKHFVIGTSRNIQKVNRLSNEGIKMLHWENAELFPKDTEVLLNCDALIISLPVSKKKFDKETAENILKSIGSFSKPVIVFSSTGVYPDTQKLFTENHTENLNSNIAAHEGFFQERLPQSIVFRLGGLMGEDRTFYRFFKDRPIPNPTDAVNHVHATDIAFIIERIFKSEPKQKVYNIVAPEHPSKMEVFLTQTNQEAPNDISVKKPSRIISSDEFINEFNYTFQYPNPAEF